MNKRRRTGGVVERVGKLDLDPRNGLLHLSGRLTLKDVLDYIDGNQEEVRGLYIASAATLYAEAGAVEEIIRRCPNITSVTLSHSRYIDPYAWSDLCAYEMRPSILEALLQHPKPLEELTCSFGTASLAAVVALLKKARGTLNALTVQINTRGQPTEVDSLVAALGQCPGLTHVRLSCDCARPTLVLADPALLPAMVLQARGLRQLDTRAIGSSRPPVEEVIYAFLCHDGRGLWYDLYNLVHHTNNCPITDVVYERLATEALIYHSDWNKTLHFCYLLWESYDNVILKRARAAARLVIMRKMVEPVALYLPVTSVPEVVVSYV